MALFRCGIVGWGLANNRPRYGRVCALSLQGPNMLCELSPVLILLVLKRRLMICVTLFEWGSGETNVLPCITCLAVRYSCPVYNTFCLASPIQETSIFHAAVAHFLGGRDPPQLLLGGSDHTGHIWQANVADLQCSRLKNLAQNGALWESASGWLICHSFWLGFGLHGRGSSVGREPAASAGVSGLIPGWGVLAFFPSC